MYAYTAYYVTYISMYHYMYILLLLNYTVYTTLILCVCVYIRVGTCIQVPEVHLAHHPTSDRRLVPHRPIQPPRPARGP